MKLIPRLRRNNKGAVLAEFVIAIVPVMTTFFSFVQLAKMATARLVVKHAAIVGARAASVMSNTGNNTPDAKGDAAAGISNAVKSAMGPWWSKWGAIKSVNVTVNDKSNQTDYYDWVEVKVEAKYACTVPIGGFWACGSSFTKTITETAQMPHQGAIYKM